MTDYSAFASPTGNVFCVTIGVDGLIHGMSNCHLDALKTHLANSPAIAPIMPSEAVKFSHGAPFALVDGAVVPASYKLATLQARQASALRASCAASITGGYPSAALGAPHSYPCNPIDQSNMIASVTASLLPGLAADWTTPFWCADASGGWVFHPHTAAQIQQAGQDGKAAVVAAQGRLAGLLAQVTAATTAEQVAAVIW